MKLNLYYLFKSVEGSTDNENDIAANEESTEADASVENQGEEEAMSQGEEEQSQEENVAAHSEDTQVRKSEYFILYTNNLIL